MVVVVREGHRERERERERERGVWRRRRSPSLCRTRAISRRSSFRQRSKISTPQKIFSAKILYSFDLSKSCISCICSSSSSSGNSKSIREHVKRRFHPIMYSGLRRGNSCNVLSVCANLRKPPIVVVLSLSSISLFILYSFAQLMQSWSHSLLFWVFHLSS